MSVRSSSGHVTELGGGCRSPDVDVTTADSVADRIDQPWRRLSDSSTVDVVHRSVSPPTITSSGERRPSFMINDILADRSVPSAAMRRSPPMARPTPLVSASRFASIPAHLDFSAAAAAAVMAQRQSAGMCLPRDGVDMERCLPAAADFRRLAVNGGAWTAASAADVVSQMSKRTSSYSAECGSDVDVDLDDDNDVDSTSSLVGQFRCHNFLSADFVHHLKMVVTLTPKNKHETMYSSCVYQRSYSNHSGHD